MARARNIKPGFFVNEDLVELHFSTRLLFIGLWTLADREGRLEDRPKKIKIAIFPADDVDVDKGLNELANVNLIVRYVVANKGYIEVVNFVKHQNPHSKEVASIIPAPCKHSASTVQAVLIPDSLTPDSLSSDCLTPDSAAEGETPHPPPMRELFVGSVTAEIQKRLDLKTLPGKMEWEKYAEWAFNNDFTCDQFIECYDLLTKQKWRNGPVKPKHISENLPNLVKLRTEIETQENGTSKQSYQEQRAELARQSHDREAVIRDRVARRKGQLSRPALLDSGGLVPALVAKPDG